MLKHIYNQDIKEMEPIPILKCFGESDRREGGSGMDYAKIAAQVIELVGERIISDQQHIAQQDCVCS